MGCLHRDEAKERHVLDLEQQTKHFEEVRENDMRNFRFLTCRSHKNRSCPRSRSHVFVPVPESF